MTTKISVTRALASLTKVEAKLEKRIDQLNSVQIARGLEDQRSIPGSLQTIDAFETAAKADFQSLTDLLSVRDELKSKVIQSNAATIVTIGNVSMTVAQAIEGKRSIQFKELLLAKMKAQYNFAQAKLTKENNDFDAKLEQTRSAYIGRDKAPDAEQLKVVEAPVRNMATPSIVDPLGLADQIRSLETEIEDFKSNVDFVLSESNAKTEVEIEGTI